MAAYYNEIDAFAAEWLRNLIKKGHIADGIVDTRSILDVSPDDLKGFVQCHFFAGVGGWPHALRRAGWRDDTPIWTGSCPCQPFSVAGKGEGFADERHLWPAFFHLIGQRRPSVVVGEQVASKDGLAWLDLVSADLEGAGYAFGAADLCAAGVGAPHIRQRFYWVGNAHDPRLEGFGRGYQTESGRFGALRPVTEAGESRGLADASSRGGSEGREQCGGEYELLEEDGGVMWEAYRGPQSEALGLVSGSTKGYWRTADWLFCRDGLWRPAEPGTFPLAHGAPARVGRLRAYGNAIVAPLAEQFLRAVVQTISL